MADATIYFIYNGILMRPLEQILDRTSIAVNGAIEHYLVQLSAGEDLAHGAQFLAELLLSLQPWLFFTEGSMENITNLTTQSAANVNVTYNLTSLFHGRLTLTSDEYAALIEHIADASDVGHCEDTAVSFMAPEYRLRLISKEAASVLLTNNRNLVFMYAMMSFVDTNILEKAVK